MTAVRRSTAQIYEQNRCLWRQFPLMILRKDLDDMNSYLRRVENDATQKIETGYGPSTRGGTDINCARWAAGSSGDFHPVGPGFADRFRGFGIRPRIRRPVSGSRPSLQH